jgi:hypothetical protein
MYKLILNDLVIVFDTFEQLQQYIYELETLVKKKKKSEKETIDKEYDAFLIEIDGLYKSRIKIPIAMHAS